MMKVKPIIIIQLIILLFIPSCNINKNKIDVKSFVLKTNFPKSNVIRLTNKGSGTAVFKMKINNNLFYNNDDIINAVIKMKPEFPDEPTERKAWRFVCDNIYYNESLTNKKWHYSPYILINSLGFGQCNDKATVLSYIWHGLGFGSRLWELEGHVVPEVYINNKWEMYDPLKKVYYLNKKSKIASVEELSDNPYLITNPVSSVNEEKSFRARALAYTKYTSELYSSKKNNRIFNCDFKNIDSYNLEFKIPANATLEFPAVYEKMLMSPRHRKIRNFANAKLTLPSNWKGSIEIPLVIHSIRGKGKVIIDGKNFKIESEKLQNYLNKRDSFVFKLKFENTISTVEIIYLINPKMVNLKKSNFIYLKGYNLDNITAKIVSIPSSLQLNLFDYDSLLENFDQYKKSINRLKNIAQIEIKNKTDFYKKIKLYINSDKDLSKTEKTEKIKLLETKFNNISDKFENIKSFKEFLIYMNEDSMFVIFVSLLEKRTKEELKDIISYLLYSDKKTFEFSKI